MTIWDFLSVLVGGGTLFGGFWAWLRVRAQYRIIDDGKIRNELWKRVEHLEQEVIQLRTALDEARREQALLIAANRELQIQLCESQRRPGRCDECPYPGENVLPCLQRTVEPQRET
jgi:hypothetical protein